MSILVKFELMPFMHEPKAPRHTLKCVLLLAYKVTQLQPNANNARFYELKASTRQIEVPLVKDSHFCSQ